MLLQCSIEVLCCGKSHLLSSSIDAYILHYIQWVMAITEGLPYLETETLELQPWIHKTENFGPGEGKRKPTTENEETVIDSH